MAEIRFSSLLLNVVMCLWPALLIAEVDKVRDREHEKEAENVEKEARPELEHEHEEITLITTAGSSTRERGTSRKSGSCSRKSKTTCHPRTRARGLSRSRRTS